MVETINLEYHIDSGHGWVAIHRNSVKETGLIKKISSCSYISRGVYYLEEDNDAPLIINNLKEKGYKVNLIPIDHNGECFIRSLQRVQ